MLFVAALVALFVPAAERAPHQRPPKARPHGIHQLVVVDGSVPLRPRPGGRVVARARARTEFGGRRVLSVAARHGAWLGVVVTELPNG